MQNIVRAERSADRPTREPADHANLDPRRQVKHPKTRAPARPGVPAHAAAASHAWHFL
jgi:hypothetical protein